MRPIATNIADFEALRKAGQTYVDKTAYFHRLVTDPSRNFFFIARPRRFGKSLGQIREKDYAAPYRAKELPVWAIRLAFDSKTRQLTDAEAECI